MLTKKQKNVLDFITQFVKSNDYAPSYREIADNLNLKSVATVHSHIKTLEKKGYLKALYNKARSIELMPTKTNLIKTINLSLVGLIAAGKPIEAVEEREMIAVPANFVTDNFNSYVLKVKGDSMIDEGILNGDYVVIERNPSPKNGDVVVALLDNTYATLKKFYREKNRIRLQPANSSLKPIYCKDPLIQGVVKAVIRHFSPA